MQIIQNTTAFQLADDTAVAIGKFDGIHKGHRLLLAEITEAKKQGLKAAVFTFDPPPAVFFGNGDAKELTTLPEKRLCFERMGIDYLIEYPLTSETAAIEPETYVEQFLLRKMRARLVVAGKDVTFGKNGAGDAALLKEIAQRHECHVKILDKLQFDGDDISSTLVRKKVEAGEMELVTELLGEPFFVSGTVLHGNELGRTIGFPTINIMPTESKILPPNGVYYSDVSINGAKYHGVANVGNKPTIGGHYKKGVETFLYGFDRDAYGSQVTVAFLHFVRRECKFSGVGELTEAIGKDVSEGRNYFGIES